MSLFSSPRSGRRVRRVTSGAATGLLLLVAAAAPASAAAADYRAESEGGGILLELFGQDALTIEGASSRAILVDSGAAAARGVGINIIEGSISEVDITSGEARDPETGSNCATPTLPAPLDGLGVGLGCSSAFARAGATNTATGQGVLGDVDLDGSALTGLVDFLVDAVVAELAANIDAAAEQLEDVSGPLLQPVIDPLAAECQAGLDQLVAETDPVFGAIDDLLDQDPTGTIGPAIQPTVDALQALTVALPAACASLLNLLLDLPELEDIVDVVAQALRDALAGLDLVQITLGSTGSTVETTADEVSAIATATGARIELPSLGALLDAIEVLVADLVGGLVAQVDEAIAEVFDDLIPAVTAILQPVLDALMLPDLLEATDPLLVIDAGRATASAVLDRDAVEVDAAGTANTVVVTLSSAFATLLGEENTTITIPGGGTQSFGEDTPLFTTISVVDTNEVTKEVDGLTLTGVKSGGVDIDLFDSEELQGGINLELATAQALAGGAPGTSTPTPTPTPTPPPANPPTLPVTGGGMALLGLLALGGAFAASRRRD